MTSFKQVDVFTSIPFKGNPVAVFFHAESLSRKQMQEIANWTNLSETTFVLKPTVPEADYKLRIFTPSKELPFAGHPTIGSAHAVIESGIVPKKGTIVQECAAGLVEIKVSEVDGSIQFKLPYYKHKSYTQSIEPLVQALGITKENVKSIVHVDDGPLWLTIQLESGELVSSLKPDFSLIPEGLNLSVFGKSQDGTYEARNFFAIGNTYIEDPVCGSGAGADASLLSEVEGFEGEFVIRQGRNVQRDGYIKVKVQKGKNGNEIFVGGNVLTILEGVYKV